MLRRSRTGRSCSDLFAMRSRILRHFHRASRLHKVPDEEHCSTPNVSHDGAEKSSRDSNAARVERRDCVNLGNPDRTPYGPKFNKLSYCAQEQDRSILRASIWSHGDDSPRISSQISNHRGRSTQTK